MGINLAAPINQLGYGVVGLNVALALEQIGRSPALWPIGPPDAPPRHHDALRAMIGRTSAYDRHAPSLRVWHQFDLAQHVGKGRHCAMPIFELTRFKPNEVHHLKAQDVVFANSGWAAEVLADNGVEAVNIEAARLGVDREIFRPDAYDLKDDSAKTNVGAPTTFLNVGKWEVRKGHDVLVEAFNKAFEPADNVRLVMNCFNPCMRTREEARRYHDEWAGLYRSSKMGARVHVFDERLPTQRDVALLMAGADCGVFPSRAEGWNLDAAEMLAMGKHVILTHYAAHTEFANATNSMPVYVDALEDAHDGIWFNADDPAWNGRPGQWAHLGESQVDQLVEHMRSVHKRKQAGELGFNHAGHESMSVLTWENTARDIASVLE